MFILDYIKLRAIPTRPNTFFKYITAQVAKVVLVNHTLRWSSPLLFNDPFDVQRDFNWGFDFEELNEPLMNEIRKLIESDSIPDLSSNPRVEWLANCLRREDCANEREIILRELPQRIREGMEHAKNNSYERIKKQWSEFIPQFRILCLSVVHDNVLMWSHYSESHRGVVLELSSINELDSPWLITQPVVYQDSPPMLATKQEWIQSITGQKRLDSNSWSLYAPYTLPKTIDWAYEKEWRVVSFMRSGESGLYTDYPFNPQELRTVYLGCEISDEDANDIIALLKYDFLHVKAYRAKKFERERKLSFERIK
jgi:hypothetical protein